MSDVKAYMGSTAGLVVCVTAAGLGLYLLVYHLTHVLLSIPYLLLIACPLMHVFHRGHGQHGPNKEIGSKEVS